MLTLIKSFSVLAALAAAAPAVADPAAHEDAPPTAVVSYADLDIGTSAGLAALQRRIDGAANRLGDGHGRTTLQTQAVERRCLSAALASGRIGVEQALAHRASRLASRAEMRVSAR
jgi:UrcA family protein